MPNDQKTVIIRPQDSKPILPVKRRRPILNPEADVQHPPPVNRRPPVTAPIPFFPRGGISLPREDMTP